MDAFKGAFGLGVKKNSLAGWEALAQHDQADITEARPSPDEPVVISDNAPSQGSKLDCLAAMLPTVPEFTYLQKLVGFAILFGGGLFMLMMVRRAYVLIRPARLIRLTVTIVCDGPCIVGLFFRYSECPSLYLTVYVSLWFTILSSPIPPVRVHATATFHRRRVQVCSLLHVYEHYGHVQHLLRRAPEQADHNSSRKGPCVNHRRIFWHHGSYAIRVCIDPHNVPRHPAAAHTLLHANLVHFQLLAVRHGCS